MKYLTTNFWQPLGRDFWDDDFFAPAKSDKNLMSGVLRTDIREEENKYVLETDVTGYKKDEVELIFEDGYLTVKVEKKAENPEEKKNYLIRERRYSSASRSFYVGDIDDSKIKADFADGVLTVELPKEEPEKVESKKRISIG